jgi:SNF family Na+-dependent transporter
MWFILICWNHVHTHSAWKVLHLFINGPLFLDHKKKLESFYRHIHGWLNCWKVQKLTKKWPFKVQRIKNIQKKSFVHLKTHEETFVRLWSIYMLTNKLTYPITKRWMICKTNISVCLMFGFVFNNGDLP